MNTEQVLLTWLFRAVKSGLRSRKCIVSARRGAACLLARVPVVSEGLLDGRGTDGTLTGESRSVAKADWEGWRKKLQPLVEKSVWIGRRKHTKPTNPGCCLARLASTGCRGRGLMSN